MESFEERIAQVDWWIPWMREFEGSLFLLWLVIVPCLIGWGGVVLLRLWRARRSGRLGPQEYRWRSGERFQFFSNLTMNGCVVVPFLFVALTFGGMLLGAFFLTSYASEDTLWNLLIVAGIGFWFIAYRWLFLRLREGLHEPEAPDFGEDPPGEPVILRLAAEARNRR